MDWNLFWQFKWSEFLIGIAFAGIVLVGLGIVCLVQFIRGKRRKR